MDKLFLCQIPLRKPDFARYEALDNSRLQVDEAFAYPLHLLIRAYAERGDHVRVLLTYNNEDSDLERIQEVIEGVLKLQERIGFSWDPENKEDLICLRQNFQQSLKYQVHLFLSLLDNVSQVDEIYADISFGNKPTPIIIAKLLEYVQKTRKVRIGHVVYANLLFDQEPDHDGNRKGYIYDISPLFGLSQQIDLVSKANSSDPDRLLRQILKI